MYYPNSSLVITGAVGAVASTCFALGALVEAHAKSLPATNNMKKIEEVVGKIFQTFPAVGGLALCGSLLAGPVGAAVGASVGSILIAAHIVHGVANKPITEAMDRIASLVSKVAGTAAAVLLTGYFAGVPAAIQSLVIIGFIDLVNLGQVKFA